MGILLENRRRDYYLSDRKSADYSICEQLKFVIENKSLLNGYSKDVLAAENMMERIKLGESLTDKQRSYVEGMYEIVLSRKYDVESVGRKVDIKRSLRYPK